MAAAPYPTAYPGQPADHPDDQGLTHDLADDPTAGPADRLERSELSDSAGYRRHGKDARQEEGRRQHRHREPLAETVSQGGRACSEPVTSLARSLDVVTVVFGMAFEISLDTVLMSAALAADT